MTLTSSAYVIYDELANKYEFPFIATSDREAVSMFYSKIHSIRNSLDVGLGFKQYTYKLYSFGELEFGSVPSVSFDSLRLLAVSNFALEVDV